MSAPTVIMAAPMLVPQAMARLVDAGLSVHALPAGASLAEMCAALQPDAILAGQNRIDAAVLTASRRLRIVARHGAGVDNVDLMAAAASGVVVTRAPDANARATAEHALSLILALAKCIGPLSAIVAAGGWRADTPTTRDLVGLRLGLVGFGPIGRTVATLASALGMDVAQHHATGGMPLDVLLARSDVLSLHCPLLPATRHILDAAALACLPRGALVVNTSRGGLIDEKALLAALDCGQVAGAGLDVFEREPPDADDPLRRHPRVIATPHMAGSTAGAMVAVGLMAAECIVAALTGGTVRRECVVPTP